MTDAMTGRDLDAEVQRRVFQSTDLRRLPVFHDPDGGGLVNGACADETFPSLGTPDWCYLPEYGHDEKGDIFCVPVPAYSSDIAAAWLVVERLAADRWSMNLEWKGRGRGYEYTAEVLFQRWVGSDFDNAHAVGDTAPLAICRAALKAQASKASEGGKL